MSPASGFTGKSELYSQFRPSYPRAALDYLAGELGLAGADLADIGCGTGLLTTAVAAFARRVYAVDCNEDMLRACRDAAAGQDNIKISFGLAENTGLPGQCVEAVISAQAFHFFDREAFRAECCRILKNDGPVILIWNSILGSELAERLKALPGRKSISGLLADDQEMVAGFYPENKYTRRVFPNHRPQTREMFIGRYLSSSYAPREGDQAYDSYVQNLLAIFDDFQDKGILNHPYRTVVYSGRL